MMLAKILAVMCPALWCAPLGVLIGQAVVPPELAAASAVANHLQDKNLTYAAIFLSVIATLATVYVVRMLIAAHEANRKDGREMTAALNNLAEAIRERETAGWTRGNHRPPNTH